MSNFSGPELVEYLSQYSGMNVSTDESVFSHPRFNAAPTQLLPVAVANDGQLRIELQQWGLVPKWAKETSIGSKMINARVETIHEKPSFRGLIASHRCVVPMRGFYEWLRPEHGAKRPFFVTRLDAQPMMVAGLWTTSPLLGGTRTFCCLTTESIGALASIHHRSPVVLEAAEVDEWLKGDDPLPLVRQSPRSDFQLVEVSTRVNSVRNDDPSLIEPLDDGRLFG